MLANETETLKLLKWLSKAIIAKNWLSGGFQADIDIDKNIFVYTSIWAPILLV